MSKSPASPSSYRIKFLAEAAFVRELKADAAKDAANITIASEHEEKDATRQGFDLVTIVAIVAIVQAALDSVELAEKIYRWWVRSKTEVVVLQTPFGTLEMRKAAGVKEADVRKFLEASLELSP